MRAGNPILEFYCTCQAPTEREERRMKLGMSELEFAEFEEFEAGTSEFWLIITGGNGSHKIV